MLFSPRRRFACWFVCAATATLSAPAIASEPAFPFNRELMLDAAPMPGSKRVPIIEVAENGAASIELWCASARGQANVGDGSISIIPGPVEPARQCPADRQSADEKLLAALAQVINWRRQADVIELRGATTLRFRLMSN